MRIVNISIIGLTFFLLGGCQDLFSSLVEEKNYLSYKHQTLNKKEMAFVLRYSANPSDSLQKLEEYKEAWLNRKIYADKGANLLTKQEREEIEYKVGVFKDNLLKFKYLNSVIEEELDTVITEEEWTEYQSQYLLKNKANQELNSFRFRFIYMVVDEFVPDLEEIIEEFSNYEKKIPKKVKDFAYYQAKPFSFNQNRRYKYKQISRMFPQNIREQILSQVFLPEKGKNETIIEKQEGKAYLIRIKEIVNTSKQNQTLSLSELALIKQEIISRRKKAKKKLLEEEIDKQVQVILKKNN